MKDYSKLLLQLANKAYRNGDIPVSAIVLYNGKIIGKGYNTRHKKRNVIGHAEVMAIMSAEKYLGDFRLNGCILISSLKPCKMCCSIIEASRLDKVYYMLNQNNMDLQNEMFIQLSGLQCEYLKDYENLFHKFFKKMR